MRHFILALAAAATGFTALPAQAQDRRDTREYNRDVRQAERDYRRDLRQADDPGDVRRANREYRRDLRESRRDYRRDARDDWRDDRRGYYADRDYRDGRNYRPRYLSRNDRVYRGSDGRYYCRRNDGTTGLIVGGLGGGVLGNLIAPGGSKTLGTILGAAGGAAIGTSVDRNQVTCR
ncbi:MAG: glycine zipper 2TM domain-containing protein [Sphingomonas sp.]|jgi:hypothetical protein|uniref:glycine zipper 2TM domain-containing protein n=1 Tax=Sphingomonas sp. TaxID=28214 RepID=UPI0025D9DFDA|nr:glycine zipper 2TM domain-containing protein [Sphingomonas sp.]MBX9881203.1 glycine zipper 2TM domain-containing protein [Sphingomonas sp.]